MGFTQMCQQIEYCEIHAFARSDNAKNYLRCSNNASEVILVT